MRSRTTRIVVLAATLFAACSSGTSKQEFVAAADEACREADERISKVGTPRVDEAILDYVRQAEKISADLVSDLEAIEPPDADRAAVDAMIDGLERATTLLEPLARASLDRDTERLEELQQEVEQITEEVNEAAESYGFEVCGAKVLDPVR